MSETGPRRGLFRAAALDWLRAPLLKGPAFVAPRGRWLPAVGALVAILGALILARCRD